MKRRPKPKPRRAPIVDILAPNSDLTVRQAAFVNHYLTDCLFNARAAARAAGYSGGSLSKYQYLLLANDRVSAAIAARLADAALDAPAVVRMLKSLASVNIAAFLRWNKKGVPSIDMEAAARAGRLGDLREIQIRPGGKGKQPTITIKVYDKVRAVELLLKHFGQLHDDVVVKNATVAVAGNLEDPAELIEACKLLGIDIPPGAERAK